ncbi:MAG: hypothetical protein WCI45_06745, partial [Desulfuromonadales bacterium]
MVALADSMKPDRQYERSFSRRSLLWFLLLALLLVLVAGFRSSDGNPDFKTYKLWYSENLLFQEYL